MAAGVYSCNATDEGVIALWMGVSGAASMQGYMMAMFHVTKEGSTHYVVRCEVVGNSRKGTPACRLCSNYS